MKVIIVGATGLVGTELIRQSLVHPSITSVIAVTRRTLAPPLPSPKFRNIIVKDYDQYATDAKSAFKGANACIWTIAITPSKSSNYPWEEVVRVCQTSTMNGLRAMHDAGTAKPFRFLYMSGIAAERDQTKTPSFKPQYCLMRGETENQVLKFCTENGIEGVAVKPGLITDGLAKKAFAAALWLTMRVPSIEIGKCARAMLDQVVNGFEKEPLMNDDLIKIADDVERKG